MVWTWTYDFVALAECVIRGVEAEFVFFDGVGRDGVRVVEAGAVAAAKDFRVDDELIARQSVSAVGALLGVLRGGEGGSGGIFVDELDDPVGVGAGGGGEEVGDDVAGDGDVVIQGGSGPSRDVVAASETKRWSSTIQVYHLSLPQ